jgi:hypothetical protein
MSNRSRRNTSPELLQFYGLMDNGAWDQILCFINGLEESRQSDFFQAINKGNTIRLIEMFERHNQRLPEALRQKVAEPRNTPDRAPGPPTPMNTASEGDPSNTGTGVLLRPPARAASETAVVHDQNDEEGDAKDPFSKKEIIITLLITGLIVAGGILWYFKPWKSEYSLPTGYLEETVQQPPASPGDATAAAASLVPLPEFTRALDAFETAQADAKKAIAAAEAKAEVAVKAQAKAETALAAALARAEAAEAKALEEKEYSDRVRAFLIAQGYEEEASSSTP